MDFQVQFDEPFAHFVLFGSSLSRASLLSLGIPFKDGVFLPFEFGHLLSQHFIPFLNNQEKNSWCRWTLPRVNAKRLLSCSNRNRSIVTKLLSSCLSVMPLV